MAEQKLIVDQLKVTYEGPFDMSGLYSLIDEFFYDKSYDKIEKLNTEQVLPGGRSIKIDMLPEKNITDYFKAVVRIRILGDALQKITIEKDGIKLPVDDGKLMLVFDGYIISDRHSLWEDSPLQWLIRVLFDKYFFKSHYQKAERWVVSDIEDIILRIKSFLNVYRVRSDRNVYTERVL